MEASPKLSALGHKDQVFFTYGIKNQEQEARKTSLLLHW